MATSLASQNVAIGDLVQSFDRTVAEAHLIALYARSTEHDEEQLCDTKTRIEAVQTRTTA